MPMPSMARSRRRAYAIQIKTSSVTTKTGGYRFTLTQRYDNMLVMCIHLPSKDNLRSARCPAA